MIASNLERIPPLLLDLDGGMEDAELPVLANLVNLSDGLFRVVGSNVTRHDVFAASQRPAVEVVDLFDGFQVLDSVVEVDDVDFSWSVFHDDVQAVHEDRYCCNKDEHREEVRADWVSDLPVRSDFDDHCCCNDTDALDHISENVDDCSSDVDVPFHFVLLLLLFSFWLFLLLDILLLFDSLRNEWVHKLLALVRFNVIFGNDQQVSTASLESFGLSLERVSLL